MKYFIVIAILILTSTVTFAQETKRTLRISGFDMAFEPDDKGVFSVQLTTKLKQLQILLEELMAMAVAPSKDEPVRQMRSHVCHNDNVMHSACNEEVEIKDVDMDKPLEVKEIIK